MNEQRDTRFVELWNDFLEGELEQEGIGELQELIANDERLLQLAADSYQLHRLLGLNVGESPERREAFVRETLSRLPLQDSQLIDSVMHKVHSEDTPSSVGNWWAKSSVYAILAASLLLVLGSLAFWLQQNPEKQAIARITKLSGSLMWTGDGGRVVTDLKSDMALNGGTLEGLVPNSWAEIQFTDGTLVTISGNSLLTFSEHEQKVLRLREGSITADVAPQPAGKPMLIHTRTAVLEVVGTRFNLDAELSSTLLNVDEGLVRVRRLSDGQAVDVGAQHRVVASADHQLVPERTPNFVDEWQSELELGPIETYGKWLPAKPTRAARLRAIPFVFRPRPEATDEESMTLYASALQVSRGDSQPVILQPNSRFEVRGSLGKSSRLFFGFQVHHPNGSFAGKFLSEIPVEPQPESDNPHDFAVQFPLSDFRLDPSVAEFADRLPSSPAGLILSSCWCFTLAPDDLELENVQVSVP